MERKNSFVEELYSLKNMFLQLLTALKQQRKKWEKCKFLHFTLYATLRAIKTIKKFERVIFKCVFLKVFLAKFQN